MPGLITEIEEREAAVFACCPWHQWKGLERGERINGVAHYRIHRLIELHVDDAVTRESERRAKQDGA